MVHSWCRRCVEVVIKERRAVFVFMEWFLQACCCTLKVTATKQVSRAIYEQKSTCFKSRTAARLRVI